MDTQQFGNEPLLRTQRMTDAEMRAVIRRRQQEEIEQGGLTDKPAVPDVAEGLNIDVADVQRLLAQVRAEREHEERLLTQEQAAAEMERFRLAEEERKRAEVRRQRTEVQRQRAERRREQGWQIEDRGQAARRHGRAAPGTGSLAFVLGTIFVVLWVLVFLNFLLGAWSLSSGPFHALPQPSCSLGNKPVPCESLPFPVTGGR